MFRDVRFLAALPMILLSALLAGCGTSGPELSDVTGTITLDGKPLVGAAVTFRPKGDAASGTASYGSTNHEGLYTLQFTRDKSGAMPGEYMVDVETSKLSKIELEENKAAGRPEPPPFVPIPKKYKKSQPLTATVKAGKNTIDFPLDSK